MAFINFDKGDKFFYEGEKIKGKLNVYTDNPSDIKSHIEIKVVNAWKSRNEIDITKDSATFGRNLRTLFSQKLTASRQLLDGCCSFDFECELPNLCPSSVESQHAYVRYFVAASVDDKGMVEYLKELITVVATVDLNNDSYSKRAGFLWPRESNHCVFRLLSCYRPVQACFNIPKMGYVPGETIYINAEVNNHHRHAISWVKAKVTQVLVYHCSLKKVKSKRVITEVTRGTVMPHDTQIWMGESMLIPAVPPSTHQKDWIQIEYKLCFEIQPSWQEKSIKVKQCLIIGTIPLVNVSQNLEKDQGDVESYILNSLSLEPCHFGPHSVDENTFSPLYPFYRET